MNTDYTGRRNELSNANHLGNEMKRTVKTVKQKQKKNQIKDSVFLSDFVGERFDPADGITLLLWH